MATYQWPVLVWSASGRGATAALVGDMANTAANASTEKEALQQLKDVLEWRSAHLSWGSEPDLVEPELVEIKVDIRPQYQDGHRLIP